MRAGKQQRYRQHDQCQGGIVPPVLAQKPPHAVTGIRQGACFSKTAWVAFACFVPIGRGSWATRIPARPGEEQVRGSVISYESDLIQHYDAVHRRLAGLIPAPKSIPKLPSGRDKAEFIVGLVCHREGVSRSDLTSECRKHKFFHARRLCYYLVYKYTKFSLPQVARLLNRKDHTTCLTVTRNMRRQLEQDGELRERLASYEDEIQRNGLPPIKEGGQVETTS